MKNYTVTLGDTLFGIAEREYGDGGLYPVIAEQNHLSNPALIDIGQELLIPYVTYRYLFTADDGTAVRQQLTQSFYGTQSAAIQFSQWSGSGAAGDPSRHVVAVARSDQRRTPHGRRWGDLRRIGRPLVWR